MIVDRICRWGSRSLTGTLLLFEVLELVAVPVSGVAPGGWVFALFDETVEGGPGPVDHAVDEFVLEWVDVDIVNAAFEVLIIFASVFMKAALPDVGFTTGDAAL